MAGSEVKDGMRNLIAACVCVAVSGCVLTQEPASTQVSSKLCALDEDGHWVGDCGDGGGGGGGGGGEQPWCNPACDPQGGFSSDLNCTAWCGAIRHCTPFCLTQDPFCLQYTSIGYCQ
jgi:hypothetical protein